MALLCLLLSNCQEDHLEAKLPNDCATGDCLDFFPSKTRPRPGPTNACTPEYLKEMPTPSFRPKKLHISLFSADERKVLHTGVYFIADIAKRNNMIELDYIDHRYVGLEVRATLIPGTNYLEARVKATNDKASLYTDLRKGSIYYFTCQITCFERKDLIDSSSAEGRIGRTGTIQVARTATNEKIVIGFE
ncbi:MAG: hypothetical protein RIG62_18300 [Cyclobacteriaceae bacterium]